GNLVVKWEIHERHPDEKAFQLEYHADDQAANVWLPIQVKPEGAGTASVRLNSASPVTVRLSVKDLAGNFSVAQAGGQGANGLMPVAFTTPTPPTPNINTGVPPVVPTPDVKPPPVVPNPVKTDVAPPQPPPINATPPPAPTQVASSTDKMSMQP